MQYYYCYYYLLTYAVHTTECYLMMGCTRSCSRRLAGRLRRGGGAAAGPVGLGLVANRKEGGIDVQLTTFLLRGRTAFSHLSVLSSSLFERGWWSGLAATGRRGGGAWPIGRTSRLAYISPGVTIYSNLTLKQLVDGRPVRALIGWLGLLLEFRVLGWADTDTGGR